MRVGGDVPPLFRGGDNGDDGSHGGGEGAMLSKDTMEILHIAIDAIVSMLNMQNITIAQNDFCRFFANVGLLRRLTAMSVCGRCTCTALYAASQESSVSPRATVLLRPRLLPRTWLCLRLGICHCMHPEPVHGSSAPQYHHGAPLLLHHTPLLLLLRC